jgi:mono/diheme cytochrome c family protein
MQHTVSEFIVGVGLCSLMAAVGCREKAQVDVGESAQELSRGGETAALVERGRYLVSHVAGCADCHSPRSPSGGFDEGRWLSGVDCFVDAAPADPERGCLSTRNLTQHETGLANRSDAQIKDMFLRGVRPDGRALHRFMPYAFLGNMHERDADAIVAYLRTVPGVDHTVVGNQAPFDVPNAPATRFPQASIPMPRADYAERAAALRGRYLAGEVGACLACHTPRASDGLPMPERAFQGGFSFGRAALGLSAAYPEVIYSSNLTPHATGIGGYAVDDVVRALKHGVDEDGEALCPPMPAGPLEAFGGLRDEDARDIAHYLLALPPGDHPIAVDCRVPEPERRAQALP